MKILDFQKPQIPLALFDHLTPGSWFLIEPFDITKDLRLKISQNKTFNLNGGAIVDHVPPDLKCKQIDVEIKILDFNPIE